MTNNFSLAPITYLVASVLVCISLGCEQQRYSSSDWAPATKFNGTLPGVGQLGVEGSAGAFPGRSGTLPGRSGVGTLPSRNLASLPWRSGNQTSLPDRQQVLVPRTNKNVKPPLPSIDQPVYDTDVSSRRQMKRVPGKPGLYLGDEGAIIGLTGNRFQQNGSGSTLPVRGNGSTRPFRRSQFGSSTLPNR